MSCLSKPSRMAAEGIYINRRYADNRNNIRAKYFKLNETIAQTYFKCLSCKKSLRIGRDDYIYL